jgi:hypothetical protein
MVRDRLLSRLDDPHVRTTVAAAEAAVLDGVMTPDQAAAEIIGAADRLR